MAKDLFIAEKPSVAQEFAKALKIRGSRRDGYIESDQAIVTWCVGHLVTMSYPEAYDPALKKWSLNTLPFLPKEFKYEIIPGVEKQFQTVRELLNREDVRRIYVCTDSGREGEYIYRLVDQMARTPGDKEKRRVWIDSQTEEEILRGIREAKELSNYDNLSSAAYLRAKEDYLMGINFSRVLTLKYGNDVTGFLNNGKWSAISVGRVMTCVLGMVVRREREIRAFVKTPFYRVLADLTVTDRETEEKRTIEAEWRAVEGSAYYQSLLLYKENGFKKREDAEKLLEELNTPEPARIAVVEKAEKKKEKKQPPLLYNLAELQNDCSRLFKISPDETLKIVQELYEKKLVTYPRTDARVLSTAVAKEITKNLNGLRNYAQTLEYTEEILRGQAYTKLTASRFVNDKQITDHYAIIPTGQGIGVLQHLRPTASKVYEVIVRRFLCIFYPPAVYHKFTLTVRIKEERFFATLKVMESEGYLELLNYSFIKKNEGASREASGGPNPDKTDPVLVRAMSSLRRNNRLEASNLRIKEGETSPPKRYNSGSMILAMENAGQLIEDEELRAQIKGSGIGTSATRAEILNKLIKISYLGLNKKTQIITPTLQGEMIYDVVNASIRSLLNPELTASWEKGLTYVAEGAITEEEYMDKLEGFVSRMTDGVKRLNNQRILRNCFEAAAVNYKKKEAEKESGKSGKE